jgi:predicted O-methyltransferase YrrM
MLRRAAVAQRLRPLRADLRYAAGLYRLPPRVAWFQLRARRRARRSDDPFSLTSVTRPRDLALVLELAAGAKRVVELGTGTGWTAIALALADAERTITTFDPVARPTTALYLNLVAPEVRRRIAFVNGPGISGPRDRTPVDLLYIDSSHRREDTIAELAVWRAVLAPGSVVIFDDFTHPEYPGVREAVRELELRGEQLGTLFVHRVE